MEMRSQFYDPADCIPFTNQHLGPDFTLINTYSWDNIVQQVKVFVIFNASQVGIVGKTELTRITD
jgi:hypothetical protein